jgi:XTP/dITP diphosphohydrolase
MPCGDRSAEGRGGLIRPATRHRRLEPGRLVLASHNAGKLREVAALVAPFGMQVVSVGELGLPKPAETEDSFLGNATIKALAAARAAGLPALADDSGFSVAALGGEPGVRTADWAMRPEGGRDYAMAMATVEERARGAADRRAWFTCALVLAWPDGHTEGFEGKVHGTWVWPPRGTHGFGYDPMFMPEGHAETFGEMDPRRKHAISHRARAFAALAEGCLPRRYTGGIGL